MKKIFLGIALTFFMTGAHAWQPSKNITIMVGAPAGGNADQVARIIADSFTQQGHSTLVVNQPGAHHALAINRVAKSAPDGYTLLLTPTSFLFNKLLRSPAATYDLAKDFTHLKTIGTVENRIYANPNTVKGSFEQVISDIVSGRKQYLWGSSFSGADFTIKFIDSQLKKNITIVNYNGNPPMLVDLIAGRIDLVVDSGTSPLNQYIESNKVKLLATTNAKNVGQITVDQYLPGVITQSWFGLSLPANAPKHIVDFYNDLLTSSLNRSETKTKLLQIGLTLPDADSTLLASVIARDLVKYQPIADQLVPK